MRELKFDCIYSDKKRSIFKHCVYGLTELMARNVPLEEVSGYQNQYGDPIAIRQFTGLKDQNGVEIYEGDLFQVANNQIYQITYAEGMEEDRGEAYGACFLLKNPRQLFPFDEWALEHGKIIGNIYENPELLK